jgi:hypothetical protein
MLSMPFYGSAKEAFYSASGLRPVHFLAPSYAILHPILAPQSLLFLRALELSQHQQMHSRTIQQNLRGILGQLLTTKSILVIFSKPSDIFGSRYREAKPVKATLGRIVRRSGLVWIPLAGRGFSTILIKLLRGSVVVPYCISRGWALNLHTLHAFRSPLLMVFVKLKTHACD